ncbi:MAG: hypothetical protein PVF73_11570 [Bacteroidales bacterium]|jgi:hypothetical protein
MFETFVAATSEDVVFAQLFDISVSNFDDNKITQETPKQEGLTLEQQFNTYHYKDLGFNDITDEHGVKVYTASELKRLLGKEVPLDYTELFKNLKNSDQKPLFDARDIVKFYQNDITKSDLLKALKKVKDPETKPLLKELYNKKYKNWRKKNSHANDIFLTKENFKTLYSLSLVKRSYDFFRDTKKPNLLITYPVLDNEKAFFSPSAREFIKLLSQDYDIWFATCGDERELYFALKKTPRIDLLILSGHGSKDNIILNVPTEGYVELSYIDTEDKELKRHLKRLDPEATIFLNACNTGKGMDNQANLANAIAKNAPGRHVVAATKPYSMQEVVVNKYYPISLEIPGKMYSVKK